MADRRPLILLKECCREGRVRCRKQQNPAAPPPPFQGRPRSPKPVQSAEGDQGKEKRERSIAVVRSPCQENYPADAHPQRAQVSAGVGKPPHGLGVCIWMHLVNGTGDSPSPGRRTPGVVKQNKSSRGSVDTTKTRSGPQRVRMSSGERPIGAAKGKQIDTEALCQTPSPSHPQEGDRGGWRSPAIACPAQCVSPASRC